MDLIVEITGVYVEWCQRLYLNLAELPPTGLAEQGPVASVLKFKVDWVNITKKHILSYMEGI